MVVRLGAPCAFALAACAAPARPMPLPPIVAAEQPTPAANQPALDPPPAPPPMQPTTPPPADHDPDGMRGALPSPDARKTELALVRTSLDTMYAHRLAKERRYQLDEDALFAHAETRLLAATTWARYDSAIYDVLVAFHDGHLTYHPPSTAAPSRGYDTYLLGLTTVLAGRTLLVATVEPGSDAAAAGVMPGDEVTAIDGRSARDALEQAVKGRVWSREESAMTTFVRTWTTVLYPKGDPPRTRRVTIAARGGGAPREVTITPREAPHERRATTSATTDAKISTVTIRGFEPGVDRRRELDDAIARARTDRAIVFDLRGNRGGIDEVGDRVLADLVEGTASLGTFRVLVAPATLALRPRWNALTAEADGYSAPQPLSVPGVPAGRGFHGPVAVVVDAACASTCEIVAAALRADLHAQLFGVTTAGSSGAPVEVTLPTSHGKIAIPTWDLIAADGHAIESDGVVPDVTVVPTPDELAAGHDPPLDAALAYVRKP